MKERCITVVVGKDPQLLSTRQMIVELAGSASRQALTVQAVSDVLEREPVRVVVLCHTLSGEERKDARVMTVKKDPRITIIDIGRAEHSASKLFDVINSIAKA